MNAILELHNISKHYPTHKALAGVTFSIPQGAFFALLGPSGCGKTTMLRLIAGFEELTTGDIRLKGERINSKMPYERNVSTVFQNYALFPHLTVRQNVEFGLRRKGAANIERSVADVLDLLQLGGKEDRLPAQLSGGEKQRVAIARSLVLSPDVLLLDEPLSALDPNLREQVRGELKTLQRRVGTTFLFITHDREEAMAMSDTIALLHRGCLEQVGTPEELYLRPRTRFAASFLGGVSWIGDIGLRPEAIRIGSAGKAQAVIDSAVFLGNRVHVTARLGDGVSVEAHLSRFETPLSPGERVWLDWRTDDEMRIA